MYICTETQRCIGRQGTGIRTHAPNPLTNGGRWQAGGWAEQNGQIQSGDFIVSVAGRKVLSSSSLLLSSLELSDAQSL